MHNEDRFSNVAIDIVMSPNFIPQNGVDMVASRRSRLVCPCSAAWGHSDAATAMTSILVIVFRETNGTVMALYDIVYGMRLGLSTANMRATRISYLISFTNNILTIHIPLFMTTNWQNDFSWRRIEVCSSLEHLIMEALLHKHYALLLTNVMWVSYGHGHFLIYDALNIE